VIATLPAAGESLPSGINPAVDDCADCGDSIAWCPIWTARWPHLEGFRDA